MKVTGRTAAVQVIYAVTQFPRAFPGGSCIFSAPIYGNFETFCGFTSETGTRRTRL
jgi:hypothetical protein